MKVEQISRTELAAIEDAPAERGAAMRYNHERVAHWDRVAQWMDRHRGLGGAYQRRLVKIYGHLVPKGKRVLEIGCAQGDLLAALEPDVGVGVDFSREMLDRARQKHPELRFVEADAHELGLEEKFDVIILSDLVNDLWDVQKVLQIVGLLSLPHTRVVLNFYSQMWEFPLRLARRLRLAKPNMTQNWLTVADVTSLLALTDFEVIRHRREVLLPLSVPLISNLANRYLAKIWPFNIAVLSHMLVARVIPAGHTSGKEPSVSIIIPARNEAGNIESIFARTPEMGAGSELIFIEGGSTDNTYEVIEQAILDHPSRRCLLMKQTGKGKGDAVRLGFARASGEVLMILDSDLTVPPEDLPRFLKVLVSGKADFVNGSRLVYPLEKEAMLFLNLIGNKFFSLMFSWLLEQTLKDTLCGTKVLWRAGYEGIAANRHYFGEFDPFGDFDLLFGAARQNMKVLDLPVRYRDRTYGTTNIQRWSHGWLLLKMVIFAARRIKFV